MKDDPNALRLGLESVRRRVIVEAVQVISSRRSLVLKSVTTLSPACAHHRAYTCRRPSGPCGMVPVSTDFQSELGQ